MKKITSINNSYIKELLNLQKKARERKKKGLFLVEGKRELSLVIKGGYQIENILVMPNMFCDNSLLENVSASTNITEITKEIYQKLAYRGSTEGLLAVVKAKDYLLSNISFTVKNPLVLVLESIEKPGNIGAILRTADAANVDAVFIADAKTDMYNPNIIRSSVGCLFTNKIAVATSEDIIAFLKKKNINIYSATLQNSNEYHKEDYTKPTAIVVGTEAVGLSEIWRNNATKNISIPMQGEIDSMNVSVACAVITFEAKRQRNFF